MWYRFSQIDIAKMQSQSPAEMFGLGPDADAAEVKSRYRELARELHPDLHNNSLESTEAFKLLQAAYDGFYLFDYGGHAQKNRKGKKPGAPPQPEQPAYSGFGEGKPQAPPSGSVSDFWGRNQWTDEEMERLRAYSDSRATEGEFENDQSRGLDDDDDEELDGGYWDDYA